MDDEEDIHVMRILVSELSEALTADQNQRIRQYHNIWGELTWLMS